MTAFTLKILASVFMLTDHIGAVFVSMPPWFRWVGRIAFPVYCYIIAQGCKHTRDINKYLLRLGAFALISEVPFDLAFVSPKFQDGRVDVCIDFLTNTNVFYTLFLGVAAIAVFEKLKRKKKPWLALFPALIWPASVAFNVFFADMDYEVMMAIVRLAIACFVLLTLFLANKLEDCEQGVEGQTRLSVMGSSLLPVVLIMASANMLHTDYEFFGVAYIFLFYVFRPENVFTRSLVGLAGIVFEYAPRMFDKYYDGAGEVVSSYLNADGVFSFLFALAAVVFIGLHNGERGPKVKWAFYWFYPAHITALVCVWFVTH